MIQCVICLTLPDEFGDKIEPASYILYGYSVCGNHVEALYIGRDISRTVNHIVRVHKASRRLREHGST